MKYDYYSVSFTNSKGRKQTIIDLNYELAKAIGKEISAETKDTVIILGSEPAIVEEDNIPTIKLHVVGWFDKNSKYHLGKAL